MVAPLFCLIGTEQAFRCTLAWLPLLTYKCLVCIGFIGVWCSVRLSLAAWYVASCSCLGFVCVSTKVVRLAFEFMRRALKVNGWSFQCDKIRCHIFELRLICTCNRWTRISLVTQFVGKVVVRGTCQVVRLVRVIQLVKSRISLDTLKICEKNSGEGALSSGTTRRSRVTDGIASY